jgi:predicted RNase H-like HicB family nuclease
MKLSYPAIFYENGGEDGYTVVVPDLPGCVSCGFSLTEAIAMGADAAAGWVLTELEDGKPAPKASRIEDVHADSEEGDKYFVSMLLLDIDAYAAKYDRETVEKSLTVTIPAWLNTFAEGRNVDYSEALLNSLHEMYVQENRPVYS